MKKTHLEPLSRLYETAHKPMAKATGLDPRLYTDPEIAAMETSAIFQSDWVCIGLASEIPNTGDYITFTVADEPVFTSRDSDGTIRSFANVCRHRMMRLLKGSGTATRVVCPYHAWTYDLKGQLIGARHMEQSDEFDKKKICLPEIRTELWNGWIYLTLNPKAKPVSTLLADLDKVVSRFGMANYVSVVQEDHTWDTNWKLLTENFMEGYHLPVAHKKTVGAWMDPSQTRFPETTNEHFTYQFFTKSEDATYGTAHPDNTSLHDQWRYTSVMPTVFPCHMYVLAPDHLWYLSLRPKGVGQVDVRFGVAIAPEVDAALSDPEEREKWIKELVTFFDHVNTEDKEVVEGIYAGAVSSFAKPGPLSWLEREIHDFQKYLAARLAPRKHTTK